MEKTFEIADPMIVAFRQDDDVVVHINQSNGYDRYETFGILIADIVRHTAAAFHVPEEDVWEWVEKERLHPTAVISQPS